MSDNLETMMAECLPNPPPPLDLPTEWVEDFPGYCAVCLDELGADRTVTYCGQKCRGILRAWERVVGTDDHRKLAELRFALADRRLQVAAREGVTDLDELYKKRAYARARR